MREVNFRDDRLKYFLHVRRPGVIRIIETKETSPMKWPFGKTWEIKCPDGTKRIVYKNPDDAFPLYAKEWFRRLEAAVKMIEKLEGRLGLYSENLIGGFFVHLDDANQSIQLHFRALYIVYQGNPCNCHEWLKEKVEDIIEEEKTLRRIQAEIRKIESLTNRQEIEKALAEAQIKLLKPETEEKISKTLIQAPKDFSAWAEVA